MHRYRLVHIREAVYNIIAEEHCSHKYQDNNQQHGQQERAGIASAGNIAAAAGKYNQTDDADEGDAEQNIVAQIAPCAHRPILGRQLLNFFFFVDIHNKLTSLLYHFYSAGSIF